MRVPPFSTSPVTTAGRTAQGFTITVDRVGSGAQLGPIVGTTDFMDWYIHNMRAIVANNNTSLHVDTVQQSTTDTSCTVPDELDKIGIGMRQVNDQQSDAVISNFRIFDKVTKK